MGYWGYGIFESDRDLDELSYAFYPDDPRDVEALRAKVIALRAQLKEQDEQKTKTGKGDKKTDDDDDGDREILWDVDLHHPRFPIVVREYLDNGILAHLIAKYSPSVRPRKKKDVSPHLVSNDYMLVLITVCAMEVGCTFPSGFINMLKARIPLISTRELFTLGRTQINVALATYIDGKPYSYGTTGVIDSANFGDEPDGRPQPKIAPLDIVPADQTLSTAAEEDMQPRAVEYGFWFSPGTCDNCGASETLDAAPLLRCSKCKKGHYCSRVCQRAHHWRHPCILTDEDKKEIAEKRAARQKREEEERKDPNKPAYTMLNVFPNGLFG